MNMERLHIFNGSKTFIALRTDMFGVEDEHVTLEFTGAFPEWNDLIRKCKAWKETLCGLPITVVVNGYATWRTQKGRYHKVALVEFHELPELSYEKNWHITLESRMEPFQRMEVPVITDYRRNEICDNIWVGYTRQDGSKAWLSYDRVLKMQDADLVLPPI